MMLFSCIFDLIENNFMTFPFLDINKSQSSIYLILKNMKKWFITKGIIRIKVWKEKHLFYGLEMDFGVEQIRRGRQ